MKVLINCLKKVGKVIVVKGVLLDPSASQCLISSSSSNGNQFLVLRLFFFLIPTRIFEMKT